MRLFSLALIVSALLATSPSNVEGKVREVRAEGRAELSAGRTPDEARSLAMKRAERNALETAVGTDVRSSTVVYNADIINDMIMTASRGIIVDKDVLKDECGMQGGKLMCFAEIKARVKEMDRNIKPPFRVKAHVQRPDKKSKVEVAVFQEGDEVQIRVKLDKPGFLNVFSIDQFGKVYPLYPNKYADSIKVDKGKEFVFPDDRLRRMGLKLKAHTLEGQKKSPESIMVVATKDMEAFLVDVESSATLTDLMAELAELGQENWAQATKGYVVYNQ